MGETSSDATWRANRAGAAAMAGAMTLLVINDSMIKFAGETMPAAQAIGIRGVFASTWLLLAALATGQARRLPQCLERRTLTRSLLDVSGTFAYLGALFHLGIAEATAINMAAPLMMILLAAVFLHERVRWQRWAAVLAGFAGMLLVVRPGGESFSPWAALCLFATALNAVRDIYTRTIPPRVPSLVISFATAAVTALAGLAIAAAQGWQPPPPRLVALMAVAAGLLAASYFLIILAMRLGEVSVVGGFRYAGLPAAALLGWIVWGHVPDAPASLGMALLVGAGLFILHHERRAVRERYALRAGPLAPAAPAAPPSPLRPGR